MKRIKFFNYFFSCPGTTDADILKLSEGIKTLRLLRKIHLDFDPYTFCGVVKNILFEGVKKFRMKGSNVSALVSKDYLISRIYYLMSQSKDQLLEGKKII